MEGCSPFLSATEGARFVFVSEVPNRRISMALLKPLCEQRGAEIASRGLYRGGNESFTPTALVVLTSNFQPRLSHDERQDTGSSTRVNVIAASSIFTENVRLPTHQQSDSRLADQVREGRLTPFAFHWLAEFYQLLDMVEHTRNVAPRPERIKQVSEMCFYVAPEESRWLQWLAKVTYTDSVAEASTIAEVHESARSALQGSEEEGQLMPNLTSAGFTDKPRDPHKRVYKRLVQGCDGRDVLRMVIAPKPEPYRFVEVPDS